MASLVEARKHSRWTCSCSNRATPGFSSVHPPATPDATCSELSWTDGSDMSASLQERAMWFYSGPTHPLRASFSLVSGDLLHRELRNCSQSVTVGHVVRLLQWQ